MKERELLTQLREIIDYLSLTRGLNWNDLSILQTVAQLLEDYINEQSK